MKKITLLLSLFATAFTTGTFAQKAIPVPSSNGVNTTTAWYNNETFEGYAAGTSLKTNWTDAGGSPNIVAQTVSSPTTGSATGIVMGFTFNGTTAFGETSQGGNRGAYKTLENTLTGLLYVKTSFYHCTNGTTYTLKNTAGNIVFEFGGINNNAGAAIWTTGATNTDVTLGNRGKWSDIEFIIDLDNNKLLKQTITHNGATKTYTDVTLAAGGDIKTFHFTAFKGWEAGGLDNTTFGSLLADGIENLTGADNIQTMAGSNIDEEYTVSAFAYCMEQNNTMSPKEVDITWSISDWGTLSTEDQAKVSLTRSTSDFGKATLSAGSISADATITLQAVFGTSTVTKTVNLKALSVAGLKSTLADEIVVANNLMTAATDNNGYIAGLKSTLTGLVNAAQAVIDNSEATISEAGTALDNLKAGETAFSDGMTPYNDFTAYISTVHTAYNAEMRTATFITTVKGTLNSAIGNANNARTTIAELADITSAKTALETAYAQYNSDIPAYAALETQISAVATRLSVVDPRKGNGQFLMYPTANVTALTEAKTSAETALTNGTTATQLNSTKTELETALSTFNAQPRIAPAAETNYKIYSYGVDNGDGGTVKNILYADGTGNLKYATTDNEALTATNLQWEIAEVSTGSYTFKNISSGTYLNGITMSETAMNYTIPEGSSQYGLIMAAEDSYFLYNIVTSTGKGLEIDTYDAGTNSGAVLMSNAPATRFRFLFQFEPVSASTGINNPGSEIRIYNRTNAIVIEGLNIGETYSVYNTMGAILVNTKANSTVEKVALKNSGVYIVQVGDVIRKIVK
ncbi:MAG: RICIN domain-containing protein [Paludibacteraceae bacterium]|nr:RICIN domain-containing protein [Paludibacteraceae bacterium]